MNVKSISIKNFRSFTETGTIEFSNINVITGPNNSGKSSLLKAIHSIQKGINDYIGDVRAGETNTEIVISIENAKHKIWSLDKPSKAFFQMEVTSTDRKSGELKTTITSTTPPSKKHGEMRLPDIAPEHFIVPYLSKRKTNSYIEDVREIHASSISSNMQYLSAKLAKFTNPEFPGYKFYADACKEILGCVVTAVTSENGQQPGIYLKNGSTVFVNQMGDGVPNIVYLLIYLATSENKLFLIEEPENDLHPKALKSLLTLISESAKKNQFIISTHSNIVVSHLCSLPESKLLKVSPNNALDIPEATIDEIPPTAEARIQVLQDLGYSFSDYDMWEGWLLLEESSAERIIRDYLIPWFAPTLKKIKTVSANGITNIEPAFKDLHRLMLFIHLQPAYANKAWVIVDGDSPGKEAIAQLQSKFTSIDSKNFMTFENEQFEFYYPNEFKDKAKIIFEIKDKQQKRNAKRELLEEVVNWLDSDMQRAKLALTESAKEVVSKLQAIEIRFTQ